MARREVHPGVRKLRYYLKKQLKYLKKGLIVEARSVFKSIDNTIEELSKERIDDVNSLEIIKECNKINDEIVIRFEAEKNGIARDLFRTEVDRKIREFLN